MMKIIENPPPKFVGLLIGLAFSVGIFLGIATAIIIFH